ncbi:MAG TPA: AraC family transcriptional regulator [Kofleriaceae bacterium]|nr:AraC family transcriptional regulator [Kofleriaceae bacterium]
MSGQPRRRRRRAGKLPIVSFPAAADESLRIRVFFKVFADQPNIDPIFKQLHTHQFFELVYLEEGRGTHRLGDRDEALISSGDLALIFPGEAHLLKEQPGSRMWTVIFTADALWPKKSDTVAFSRDDEDLLLHLLLRETHGATRQLRVPPAERSQWVRDLRRLKAELDARPFGYRAASRALLTLLLLGAARLAREGGLLTAAPLHPALGSVFQYIEKRFRSPISLADVAKAVQLSPAYLTDLVRRATGRTVLRWITERRMAEARALLLQSDLVLQEVAYQIGYDDVGHFIRQFRKMHGVPPEKWRRSNQVLEAPSLASA